MSLDYELSKIRDWRDVCLLPSGDLKQVTEAIIWRTMVVGIGKITADNAVEFYARSKMFTLAHDSPPLMRRGEGGLEPSDLTLQEIKAHIGLTTNVSTTPQAKFLKYTFDQFVKRESK